MREARRRKAKSREAACFDIIAATVKSSRGELRLVRKKGKWSCVLYDSGLEVEDW